MRAGLEARTQYPMTGATKPSGAGAELEQSTVGPTSVVPCCPTPTEGCCTVGRVTVVQSCFWWRWYVPSSLVYEVSLFWTQTRLPYASCEQSPCTPPAYA